MLAGEAAFTDLGRFEGIICRKMNGQEKYPPLVGTVRLQQETQRHSVTIIHTLTSCLYYHGVFPRAPAGRYLQVPL